MKKIVLDTSVIVKWFADEEDSGKAVKLLEQAVAGELEVILPGLTLAEAANALRYNNLFQQSEVEQILVRLVQLDFKFIETREIIADAIPLAYHHEIAIYDALFIALSERINADLITADYRHHTKDKSDLIVWLSET